MTVGAMEDGAKLKREERTMARRCGDCSCALAQDGAGPDHYI